MLGTLALVFLLNVVSTALGTLKTLFLAKGFSKPAYIVTFLDTIMYIFGIKLVMDGEGIWFVLIYSLGRTIGVYLGDILEQKLALGILDVTIMAKIDKAHAIADHLRRLGYTSNSYETHGVDGEEKWDVRFLVARREFDFVLATLENKGFTNLSMVVTSVNKVSGKIRIKKAT